MVNPLTENPIITLYEYDNYQFEIGTKNERIGKRLRLTPNTIEELDKLSSTTKFIQLGRHHLRALNYAGVIKTSNCLIEIFPKICREANEESHAATMYNLLKMISYADSFLDTKETESDLKKVRLEKQPFFEIFVYLFASNLLRKLRVRQNREYTRTREELGFVKGKIDFHEFMNLARVHIIPCYYFQRSSQNTINRVLKYVSYLLFRKTSRPENVRLLQAVLELFDDVELRVVSLQEISSIIFHRLNYDFKPFIDFCKLFLSGSMLTLQASNIETFSIMIPMQSIFEQFISKIIQQHRIELGISNEINVILQTKGMGTRFLAEDRRKKGIFLLRPDVILSNGAEVSMIDTKYKVLQRRERKLNVSQADMYQMFAYVSKFEGEKALLLYPQLVDNAISQEWSFGPNKKLRVQTIDLSFDMNNEVEWSAFIQNLKRILADILPLNYPTLWKTPVSIHSRSST